ncbi:SUMF1/EgtB/PvdO family nonheme iron enzyme [Paenibacillus daejeonensis]|uniref:SUMF1/EgtB/PvdO family nonheme iron enzyme n=1 Tax=Paenibacillus daejeonensis TaxID=135193 RepID=UPI000368BA41|nr:SUMF1/EgtB/PvdO family nonheme iron enzyme [Paenibacillus daejeonensis]
MQHLPDGSVYTNAIGMQLMRIEPGTYKRGSDSGDLDEQPVHQVRISQPFYMGKYQVTNKEYERFDPRHRELRGKLGFSCGDDEAVVFVSWHEAVAYCRWLSERDGRPYRLPTEAEWEYACRAGTETAYAMGEEFPRSQYRNQQHSWYPDPVKTKREFEVVPLTVGEFPPNDWGLHDMHGNVEEWCQDWYGPYVEGEQTDPVGRVDGDFRVTRGGSHSTDPRYLRSAERMATLPEDKHWLIGFRVVLAEPVATEPLPPAEPYPYQLGVSQTVIAQEPTERGAPYFAPPRVYVKLEPSERGPFFRHNHSPYVAETPNGDLLAAWFTTNEESGREMKLVASRLRYGSDSWDDASLFWDAPDRNMTAGALWLDEQGKLLHITGLGAAGTWGTLVQVLRTSEDNGVTWSKGRILYPEHGVRTMPIPSLFRMNDGTLVFSCDAETGSTGGSTVWLSEDDGDSWFDGGGLIRGIHAPVAEIAGGRLLAYGRGDEVHGHMARSISSDRGKSWVYSESEFDPIGMGQRAVMRRLQEGVLFMASFADGMEIQDRDGVRRPVQGLFAAVSLDDGETWPYKRLVTTDEDGGKWDGGAWTGEFRMDRSHAEPKGYLAMVQAKNGLIHLLSSRIHYCFNLDWVMALSPGLGGEGVESSTD